MNNSRINKRIFAGLVSQLPEKFTGKIKISADGGRIRRTAEVSGESLIMPLSHNPPPEKLARVAELIANRGDTGEQTLNFFNGSIAAKSTFGSELRLCTTATCAPLKADTTPENFQNHKKNISELYRNM